MAHQWTWPVRRVLNVVDGDTIDLLIDRGFGTSQALRVRLIGVDTPERGDDGWAAATEATRYWLLSREDNLLLHTYKATTVSRGIGDGGFGRWLGDVWNGDQALTAHLRSEGHTK